MKRTWRWMVFGVLAALLWGGEGGPVLAEVDEGMARDIRIMEGVLEELLGGEADGFDLWRSGPDISGMYFEGYGVLFLVEKPTRPHMRFDRRPSAGARDSLQASVVARTKARLKEFYTNYAMSMRRLSDQDRITIRVEGQGNDGPFKVLVNARPVVPVPPVPPMPKISDGMSDSTEDRVVKRYSTRIEVNGEHFEKQMEHFEKQMERFEEHMEKLDFTFDGQQGSFPGIEATATMKDVKASRGPTFRELDADPDSDRSIRIMEGILEKAIGGRDEVSGFRQEGLGAVFFVASSPSHTWHTVVGDHQIHMSRADADGADAYADRFKRELVTVVGDYGSTLKGLAKSESIIVKVDFGRWGRRKGRPSGFLLEVKKETMDRYSSGEMSMDAFSKAVTITEL